MAHFGALKLFGKVCILFLSLGIFQWLAGKIYEENLLAGSGIDLPRAVPCDGITAMLQPVICRVSAWGGLKFSRGPLCQEF